jgi:hypothetical protein
MKSSSRAAISRLATGAIAIVIVAGVVATAFLAVSPAAVSSTSVNSLSSSLASSLTNSSVNSSLSSSSSSLGSSSSLVSSSSSNNSPTSQSLSSTNQSSSSSQYPLVWAPNSPSWCGGASDFCINALVGFADNATVNATTSYIGSNGRTTIIISHTTVVVSSNSTIAEIVQFEGQYIVTVNAYVQDAVTGQNVSIANQSGTCGLYPTGYTKCIVDGGIDTVVPSGDPYKITVWITRGHGSNLTQIAPTMTITVSSHS